MSRTYTELSKLQTYSERLEYLKLNGSVGFETFGPDRYLNQKFYSSGEWKALRNRIIVRDNGCDLGLEGFEIKGEPIYIHHMNPIKIQNILDRDPDALNPEYLICVSDSTHRAIHYGYMLNNQIPYVERTMNDTCPWKK